LKYRKPAVSQWLIEGQLVPSAADCLTTYVLTYLPTTNIMKRRDYSNNRSLLIEAHGMDDRSIPVKSTQMSTNDKHSSVSCIAYSEKYVEVIVKHIIAYTAFDKTIHSIHIVMYKGSY